MREVAHPGLKPIPTIYSFFPAIMFVAFSLLFATAYGQDAVGSLEGRISARNGAVVSGASVALRNLATNAIRNQTSDSAGLYRFVQLGVGTYALSVDAPGFGHFAQETIEMTVSQGNRRQSSSRC